MPDYNTSEDKAMELNSITDVLRGLEGGRTLKRIDDELHELLQQIKTVGKQGEITIKLTIMPQKNSELHMVRPVITAKPPNIDPSDTPMYLTDDASLSLRNPRQPELFEPPRPVDDQQEETRRVEDDAG